MIDIEEQVFAKVYEVLHEAHPSAFVANEYVSAPPKFPCVTIIEEDNEVYRNSRDSGDIEQYAQLMYEVNAYSNSSDKKKEAKDLIAIVDGRMTELGFTRITTNVVPNYADNTIYRMVARYRALVDTREIIYRR